MNIVRMFRGRRRLILAGIIAAAAASAAIGALGGGRASPGPNAQERAAIEAGYACPMHPEIVSSHPDHCPICGMELTAMHGAGHVHGGSVDANALANLGVRVVAVERRDVEQVVNTFGTVVPNENSTTQVSSGFDGWVRHLAVHSVGERVRAGQVLYEIYSPEIVAKEREYFQFLTRRKQVLQAVGDVSQQENEYVMDLLREWQKEREDFLRRGIGIETVQQLEQTGITIEVVKIHAQSGGVITQIHVQEGAFVSPASPIMTITDAGSVWVDVALGAGQFERVQPGDAAIVTSGDGGQARGSVSFVSPVLEAGRGHARVVLPAGEPGIRIGSIVDVAIHSAMHSARVVPAPALLRTGHGDFVMLAREDGRFVPAQVTTGTDSEEVVEIRGGLQEGARIASNAQFLLDPSASLADTRERLTPRLAGSAP
jgi:Cu(I)/Ag(I) efflux system membrane fusion protein